MILGKPTLQTVLSHLKEEGCPRCGKLPNQIQINGPDEIVLECGHVVDEKVWIDIYDGEDGI